MVCIDKLVSQEQWQHDHPALPMQTRTNRWLLCSADYILVQLDLGKKDAGRQCCISTQFTAVHTSDVILVF